MPLYEYKCESCGEVFEKMQKFADEPLKIHEACGGAVHRLLSPPVLQFKGSGWYITDYAHGKSGSNGKSKAETKGDSKTESSTSKPESAPPASSTPAPSESK